ncbi:hypothetical protein LWI28_015790 [Acer negundo]|uniref:Reverse transcriptase zinc-binding domain-containing protein n=1 Tax=Acer negundo TaxID=4023 RepID=A0AAD5JFH3_ACENE|nr:hypothetical protein LWI28_015790 [Acer negundo]
MIWHFDKRGDYTVRSGYRLASSFLKSDVGSSSNLNRAWWKFLWNLSFPPKVRSFLWRCCISILTTLDNLARRKVPVSPFCSRCGDDKETQVHELFSCVHAEAVWIQCGWWHHITAALNNDTRSILERMKTLLSQQDFNLFCMVQWSIWAKRNRFVHEGYFKDPNYVVDSAKTMLNEFQNAMASLVVQVRPLQVIRHWSPPPSGCSKLNVDVGFWCGNVVGVGAVLRDHVGSVRACLALPRLGSFSVELGELFAIRESMLFLNQIGLQVHCLESDSTLAVSSIKQNSPFSA